MSDNFFDLSGKVAVVTGASSGLGRQFALTLARHGARVAITARRTDRLEDLAKEIESFDGRALPIQMDVGDVASIQKAFEEAETELGPITIAVNNAGLSRQCLALDITEENYDLEMDTNLKGVFFSAQAAARHMRDHGQGGSIINIASASATAVVAGLSTYASSKAGVVHLTKALALEWARYKIRVNAISPGYIETEINKEFFDSPHGQKFISTFLNKRIGQPSDLDGQLLLLASDHSTFMTGANLLVDDGQTVAF